MTEPIKLPSLPEGWETELLDWVSACQSAYHIDNTPGHRFGGLGINLEENRLEIVSFVRGLIENHVAAAVEAALQSQDRDDASHRASWAGVTVWIGDKQRSYGVTCEQLELSNLDALQIAFDHARRIEGDGE